MPRRKLFLSLFPLFLVCGIVTSSSSAQNGKSSLSLATASGWTAKHAPSSDITVAGTIQQVSSEHTPGSLPGLGWDYDRLWGGTLNSPREGGSG